MSRVMTNSTALPPLLLSAKQAALLCGGVSVRTWWRWDSEGAIPRALKVGRSKRWLRSELISWCLAGAPTRDVWDAMRNDGTSANNTKGT